MELLKTSTDAEGSLTFVGFENPFRVVRQQAGLSQAAFAHKVGLSKHAVLRNEQGMYVEPLPALVNYVTANWPVGRVELLQQYERFQIAVRQETGCLLGNDLIGELATWLEHLEGRITPKLHPLVWLRIKRGYNPTSFSKALCINQTVVSYFEKNPINQKTVPEQLRCALIDCGYTDHELDELDNCYDLFRMHANGIRNLRSL